MKKIFTLSVIAALSFYVFAQAPQKLSYQAVVRNSAGGLVSGKTVGMQISILQGSESGTAVYVERHTTSTNTNGLATVEVGGGTPVSGSFLAIDWSAGIYFIKTETDPAGGTSYTISGTSQLLSVPYALHSKTAKDAEKLILPWSGTVAHTDYAFKIVNSTSSALSASATATSGITYAVYAENRSLDNSSAALRGTSIATGAPATTYGVFGSSSSASGHGVAGIASSTTGINNGTSGTTYSPDGRGVYGLGGSETGSSTGVYGATNSPSGKGIYGIAFPATGSTYGISGHVNSPDGYSGYFTGGRFHVAGNAGIGTTNPSAKLEVAGQVKITGGSPAAGQVLTSDASGLATWEPVPVPALDQIYFEVKRDASYNWPVDGEEQKINFSTNSTIWENKGGAFDQATSTFTAPEDGIYSFKGTIHFARLNDGSLIYVYLLAGKKKYMGNLKESAGNEENAEISLTLFLLKNDTAQLWGFVINPGPPTEVYGTSSADGAFTYFTGAKVN